MFWLKDKETFLARGNQMQQRLTSTVNLIFVFKPILCTLLFNIIVNMFWNYFDILNYL